jgi:tetratricopeptide (TPR) repeat protein
VLAGRVAELRELHSAAVRAAAERRGWVGLIGGEPGIGKTRLAAACAAKLAEDGFGCAWVTCPEDNGAPPFWVWGQLLGQLGAGDVLLLRPGAGQADPELSRFLLFEAVAARIREAATSRSLLLVVDDLHWADPGSRRLLAAIRGALATLPVVALCTYRDTEPTADALCAEVGPERHLVLGGLAPGELATAVRMATGSAVPDALLDGLHARTAGNPYFAAEAVRLLRAEGRLDASGQLPAELLPRTVRAVLERRLARLPAAAAGLLPMAALLGDELSPPLLAEIAGEPLATVASALESEQRETLSTGAVAMARRLGDPAVLAAALAARCDVISGPDHVAERRSAAAEIIELARAGGDRTGEMLGRRLLVVALAEAAEWSAVDAEISSYARAAGQLAQHRLTWYVPLWRGARALMRGDLALADEHARELGAMAERAGSVNARLLGLVQRFVRLVSEGRTDELAGDFTEIVGLIPDEPQSAACAQALLNAHRGRLAEARADLDRVVAGIVPRDGEWLPKYAQVSVAAVLAGHRTAAELAYRLLTPYAGHCAVEGILAGSWGSVAAHLGLLARYLGRAEDADAHFARAAELDAAAGAALAARTREWANGGSAPSGGSAPDGGALFRPDGEVWTLRYAGQTVRLRDSKGLRDLAVLLGRPDEQTHVSELTRAGGFSGADAGPVVDRRALAAYRQRLRRIDAELASAGAGTAEAQALSREREALLAELSATTGLGGRPRVAGSPTERMRKAVTYRIRHAIARVADAHPELGRHLRASVRTGTWCSYAPEHRVDWQQR